MAQEGRMTRRVAGVIAKRLPDVGLHQVADPRSTRGRRWKLRPLLTMMLVGMFAGCKGLGEVEDLSDDMSLAMRRLLGLRRRTPDTTMRELLCRLAPEELRQGLHRLVKRAWRRKALKPDGLPFGAVSMDGKVTATTLWELADQFAQLQRREDGSAYALVRTITNCMISSAARVCIDAHPVPPDRNENTAFPAAFERLVAEFGRLFRLVLYDSGGNSASNAAVVVDAGKDYLFRVQSEQPTLFKECQRLLAARSSAEAASHKVDCVSGKVVERRVWLSGKVAGYHDYPGLQTAIRTQSVITDKTTGEVTTEDRYFISSMKPASVTPRQWLDLIRRHWSVENANHNTWDRIFREDDRPWVRLPRAMLNVMLLRRIAYNLQALFRSVTQRSDAARAIPWKRLQQCFYIAVVAATDAMLVDLRRLREPRAVD